MTKKLIIIVSILIVAVGGGLWYGKSLFDKKLSESLLKDVDSKAIANQLKDKKINKDVLKTIDDLKTKDQSVSKSNGTVADNSQITNKTINGMNEANKNSTQNTQQDNNHTIDVSKNVQPSDNSTINTSKNTQHGDNSTTNEKKNIQSNKDQPIKTREDVTKLVESRLSTSEILHLTQLYENRKNLTKEQKETAKAEVLSHFTPEEINMMLQVAGKN
ncbi:hypothetical protein ACFQZ1_26380 [Bacillus sp. CGMCC 1.60114]|uniref:hypothetical protein n=1 Tax=unclassified Bacillus (in: firmicutes) TaxID=185979 RepID=UPI00362E279D